MSFKKYFFIVIVLFFILFSNFSFADDYSEEDVLSEIPVFADISKMPIINARHYVVFDRHSKTTLFGKKEIEKCKMASTTKIMTAVVVLENCDDLNEIVTISKKSARNWRF